MSDEFAPVICTHCGAECNTPCEERDCKSRLCEGCMKECEGCQELFCEEHLIVVNDIPACKACHAEYLMDQMEHERILAEEAA